MSGWSWLLLATCPMIVSPASNVPGAASAACWTSVGCSMQRWLTGRGLRAGQQLTEVAGFDHVQREKVRRKCDDQRPWSQPQPAEQPHVESKEHHLRGEAGDEHRGHALGRNRVRPLAY